jgi:hypothetical protein
MVALSLLKGTRRFERRERFGMVLPLFDPRTGSGCELFGHIEFVDVGIARGTEQLLLADP